MPSLSSDLILQSLIVFRSLSFSICLPSNVNCSSRFLNLLFSVLSFVEHFSILHLPCTVYFSFNYSNHMRFSQLRNFVTQCRPIAVNAQTHTHHTHTYSHICQSRRKLVGKNFEHQHFRKFWLAYAAAIRQFDAFLCASSHFISASPNLRMLSASLSLPLSLVPTPLSTSAEAGKKRLQSKKFNNLSANDFGV